jgi:hypothetical protein
MSASSVVFKRRRTSLVKPSYAHVLPVVTAGHYLAGQALALETNLR